MNNFDDTMIEKQLKYLRKSYYDNCYKINKEEDNKCYGFIEKDNKNEDRKYDCLSCEYLHLK